MPQHAPTPDPAKPRDAAAQDGPRTHVGLHAIGFSAGTRPGPSPAAVQPLQTGL